MAFTSKVALPPTEEIVVALRLALARAGRLVLMARLTLLLKLPLVSADVIVVELLDPRFTVRLDCAAESVNCAGTVTVNVVWWVRLPPSVAVIVSVVEPEGAPPATLTVMVDAPDPPVTGFGLKLHVIGAAQPELRVTAEEKPLIGDTVTVEVDSEAPAISVIGEGVSLRAKSPLPPPLPPHVLNLYEPM